MNLRPWALLLIAVASWLPAAAQFDNSAFYNRIKTDSTETGSLRLDFYNFNYVRNYEFFGPFQDGYTLYGTQLQPRLVYQAHPNLVVSAGAWLRKDFGANGITDAKPLFQLKYQKAATSLIFGSLEGGLHHRYIEPLYDFERQLTNPIEYGTQLLIDREKFFLDAWIAWQKMIYKASPVKEEILAGLSVEKTAVKNDDVQLSFPLQLMVYHQGGQIDTLKSVPLSTLFNGAAGFRLHKTSPGFVADVFTDNYLVAYKDFSPDKRRAFDGGFGLWLNAGLRTQKFGTFITSFWHGNKFLSVKGMPLYQSVSQNMGLEGYTEQNRDVLMFRYVYQKELLPKLFLDVRLEPHLDLSSPKVSQIEFSNSFFLTYREDFRLFKRKK
ncbi:hypothetical protein [Pedobacter sp. SYP-B3415]|uniref:hypothetical protein n=1 Tax=Pedobacter sp. SYP-B3415 TaxID=2496641 RepID=UPI00101E1A06|nr:hypothetical protein [Pedobacter sp. SYP-B3415]